jgi:5'-3' exonuclease
VAGIGPKTAVSLLKQFGSLDEVLEHAGEAKSKKAAAQLSSGGAGGDASWLAA